MKITEVIDILDNKKSELGDVDVRIVSSPLVAGFGRIDEILDRRDYRDENFFGSSFERGNFVVIEIKE